MQRLPCSRCACTVHHGGAGTTAAALRAGVPTIVVLRERFKGVKSEQKLREDSRREQKKAKLGI